MFGVRVRPVGKALCAGHGSYVLKSQRGNAADGPDGKAIGGGIEARIAIMGLLSPAHNKGTVFCGRV